MPEPNFLFGKLFLLSTFFFFTISFFEFFCKNEFPFFPPLDYYPRQCLFFATFWLTYSLAFCKRSFIHDDVFHRNLIMMRVDTFTFDVNINFVAENSSKRNNMSVYVLACHDFSGTFFSCGIKRHFLTFLFLKDERFEKFGIYKNINLLAKVHF